MKEVIRKYDLKKRLYLGPTSLDDSLALLLANISKVSICLTNHSQALDKQFTLQVRPGSIAYDPFVGTASILVALTHFGAICVGNLNSLLSFQFGT